MATEATWDSRAGLCVEAGAGPPVSIDIRGHRIGGGAPPVYVAGPCSIESEQQLDRVAGGLAALGVEFLRGGAFKPRSSPYAFQGLGLEGLEILHEVGHRYGMVTVTEATSPEKVALVARYADIIQIGSRNMYNYELLREAGRAGKPVLLKRGFSATLDEWLQAAEYVALGGNERIVLCERGIRTFEKSTRNTLDISAVPLSLQRSRLPVVVDVSHATGRRDIIPALARAAFAVGAHGIMVEVHPNPAEALSDAEQQLTLEEFAALQRSVADGLFQVAGQLSPPKPPARTSTARIDGSKKEEVPAHAPQCCLQLR